MKQKKYIYVANLTVNIFLNADSDSEGTKEKKQTFAVSLGYKELVKINESMSET